MLFLYRLDAVEDLEERLVEEFCMSERIKLAKGVRPHIPSSQFPRDKKRREFSAAGSGD